MQFNIQTMHGIKQWKCLRRSCRHYCTDCLSTKYILYLTRISKKLCWWHWKSRGKCIVRGAMFSTVSSGLSSSTGSKSAFSFHMPLAISVTATRESTRAEKSHYRVPDVYFQTQRPLNRQTHLSSNLGFPRFENVMNFSHWCNPQRLEDAKM